MNTKVIKAIRKVTIVKNISYMKRKQVPKQIKLLEKEAIKLFKKIVGLKQKPKIYYCADVDKGCYGEYYGIINRRPTIVLYMRKIWVEFLNEQKLKINKKKSAKELMREIIIRTIIHELIHYKFEKSKMCSFLDNDQEESFVIELEDKIWEKICINL